MRVCTIVGARPQFVKAAVVSRALAAAGIEEVLIHTGQHYDAAMSRVFFDDLGIPRPAINLNVGSGSHAVQTGAMMTGLETFLQAQPPVDFVVIYGDTNSTLAGTLVAAKLHIPMAHVEAGLRSFNRRMPEEINRIVADQLATLLFCPTQTAIDNLEDEGITEGVHLTGDVMLDATRFFGEQATTHAPLRTLTSHGPQTYYLATVHRAENTDDPARLAGIFGGLGQLDAPVLLPLHPRTRTHLGDLMLPENVVLMEPASYLAMLTLVRHAKTVFTDSGGLQKEAFWLGVPCITLRDETEWVETLDNGWNRLAGANTKAIATAVQQQPTGPQQPLGEGPDGSNPSQNIARILKNWRSST